MASNQGPGPPGEGCEEAPGPSLAEQQVARDTEEVFQSYVYYRHRQEQEAEGAAAPADPEMETLSLEPSSTLGQVGRRLAIIGDDINRRYDAEFQNLLRQLQPTAENAYDLFIRIASRPATRTGNLPPPLPSLCPSVCSLGGHTQRPHPAGSPLTLSSQQTPQLFRREAGALIHGSTGRGPGSGGWIVDPWIH
ncbi:bcl-2 homologous antagonist/killer isoform X2 [Fukomys damarensis]|uniref:bcl-2 homologous antagonist/killer isoform X2 n=1 Tax=Fukomys damarensis TaxID=885580 RepID=UPI00053FF363|nr:bcl-2 homologous antagonist/killer isoform X2 [Fukomys damarensis]